MSWRPATGELPREARGKRVKVKLRNGMVCGTEPVATGAPSGWHADERAPGKGPPVRWRHDGSDFDVVAWDFA